MSNRRKRKQARRQERKSVLTNLSARRPLNDGAGMEFPPVRSVEVATDEWDDFDMEHEVRIHKERAIKSSRAKKQALVSNDDPESYGLGYMQGRGAA